MAIVSYKSLASGIRVPSLSKRTKSISGTCKPGQRADLTGCSPAEPGTNGPKTEPTPPTVGSESNHHNSETPKARSEYKGRPLEASDFLEDVPPRTRDYDRNENERVVDHAENAVAKNWNVDESDLMEIVAEQSKGDLMWQEGIIGKSKDELKRMFIGHLIRGWTGSSGGAVPMEMIRTVADDLGLKYVPVRDDARKYIKQRPGIDRAISSLGRAMYGATQKWFKDRGITKVYLTRSRIITCPLQP